MTSLPARQTTRPRLGFIDAARTLAMLMMLQGHVCDTLLVPAAKTSAFFQHYWFLRGLTAPLFFMLSGFAVVIASDSRWDEYRVRGPMLYKRLRRAAILMLIGYAFQVPRWSGGIPFTFSHEEWRYVLRSGVLHCVGWSMVLAHLLMVLSRTRKNFTYWAFGLAVVTLVATPVIGTSTFAMPTAFAMLLRANEGALFPLFPFLAHFFLGATAARLYLDWSVIGSSPRRLAVLIGGVGGAMAVMSLVWTALDPGVQARQASNPAADLPLFFNRAGFAWLLFAALTLAFGPARSPRWMKSVSSNALSVYVLHLVVLYGFPGVTGIVFRIGPTLSLTEAFIGGPLLLAFCALVMATWDKLRDLSRPLVDTAGRLLPTPVLARIRVRR